jgi:hypothetical protein
MWSFWAPSWRCFDTIGREYARALEGASTWAVAPVQFWATADESLRGWNGWGGEFGLEEELSEG